MGQCSSKDPNALTFATPSESDPNLARPTKERDEKVQVEQAVASPPSECKQVTQTKSEFMAQLSTPSAIETEALTKIYRVPDTKYPNAKAVLQDRGVQLLEMIDEGGFAKVFKARKVDDPDGQPMACKVVDIGDDYSDNAKLADVKNELFVMEKVKHPHVVRLFEHFIINDHLYIFMDYADFGNLYRFLYQKNSPFTEEDAKKPFAQITNGIAYMHAKKIAHRDLKLSNILLKTTAPNNIVILIADFGLSRVVYRKKTGLIACKSYCGTPNYMAPELKQHKPYNAFEIDMYALGVMLFTIIQSTYPFDDEDDNNALAQAVNSDIQWAKSHPLSDICRKMITGLLKPNPAERMLMCELMHHQWFAAQMAPIAQHLPDESDLPQKSTTQRATSPSMDFRVDQSKKSTRRPKSTDGTSKRTKSPKKRSSSSHKSKTKSLDQSRSSSKKSIGPKSNQVRPKSNCNQARPKPTSNQARTKSKSPDGKNSTRSTTKSSSNRQNTKSTTNTTTSTANNTASCFSSTLGNKSIEQKAKEPGKDNDHNE